MKALALAALLFFANHAFGETLSVEFQWCSNNENYVCAKVYGPYGGQEMGVQSDANLNEQIMGLIGQWGRSLAINIDGRVQRVNRFGGGQYYQLVVNGIGGDPSAPRPRGF